MKLEERLDLLVKELGADHKAQGLLIAGILAKMGSLTGLATQAKGSFVAAINEIKAAVGSASMIDDAAESSTEKTYSIDQIKILIAALKQELLGGIPAAALDTLVEIGNYITSNKAVGDGLVIAVGNRVSYDKADNKTDAEKAQARANIGAISSVDIGNYDADLVAVYTTAKTT